MLYSLVYSYLSILALLSFSPVQCDKKCDIKDRKFTTQAAEKKYLGFLKAEKLIPLRHSFIDGTIDELFQYELSNSSLHHLNNCKVQEVSFNTNNSTVLYSLKCSRLTLTSDYVVLGSIGKIKNINGDGYFTISVDDAVINITSNYKLNKQKDSTYIQIENNKVTATVKKVKYEGITSETDQNNANTSENFYNTDGQDFAIKELTTWIPQMFATFVEGLQHFLMNNSCEKIFTKK